MNTCVDVFQQSTDAVFGIDKFCKIRFANRSFERLMGYSIEQLCGACCANVLCGTDLLGKQICGPHCPVPKVANGQSEVSDFDLMVKRADGESILVNIGACYIPEPMQAANDQITVFFSMRQVNPQRMLQRMSMQHLEQPVNVQANGYGSLTPREKDVLGLASKGMTTSQIADLLFVSPLTVRTHFKHIYPKLGVNNRTEAVIYALDHGMH